MKASLANIVFPKIGLCTEEFLYFRCMDGAYYKYDTASLVLPRAACAKFDTYFNSFSVGKWNKHTTIADNALCLTFRGRLVVRIGYAQLGRSYEWLKSVEIASDGAEVCIDLPEVEVTANGIIGFECYSVEDSEILSGRYTVGVPPENNIKLGVVITTFNRIPYVKETVGRLKEFIKDSQANIRVIVVDNGRNVDIESDENVTLIQNNNLGGAGGFARGMYELENDSSFTHCLFMDDDALSEAEAVFRGYQLLAYARDERLAIAGSMLLEEVKFIQHENGARFNKRCFAMKHGFDLRDPVMVLHNELEEHIDYGAWWFFGFSLKVASEYPYPYFIRGDDISFSMSHDFEIITLNGINTWQSNFEYKSSPLTLYLDMRSHILHHLHHAKLPADFRTIMGIVWPFVMRFNLRYQYFTAKAIIESVEDMLKGPEFIEQNVDTADIRERLKPLIEKERLEKKSVRELCAGHYHRYGDPHESRFVRLMRIVTLNGHLLPRFIFRHAVVVPKAAAPLRSVFMYKEAVFYHEETGEGYVAPHSKSHFFANLYGAMKVSFRLLFRLKKIQREYNARHEYLTSGQFWEKHFLVK